MENQNAVKINSHYCRVLNLNELSISVYSSASCLLVRYIIIMVIYYGYYAIYL